LLVDPPRHLLRFSIMDDDNTKAIYTVYVCPSSFLLAHQAPGDALTRAGSRRRTMRRCRITSLRSLSPHMVSWHLPSALSDRVLI
jgi:hypothetical protein